MSRKWHSMAGRTRTRVIGSSRLKLRQLLAPRGLAAIELGSGMADEVGLLFAAAGLMEIGRRRDLAGIERCALFARDSDTGFLV